MSSHITRQHLAALHRVAWLEVRRRSGRRYGTRIDSGRSLDVDRCDPTTTVSFHQRVTSVFLALAASCLWTQTGATQGYPLIAERRCLEGPPSAAEVAEFLTRPQPVRGAPMVFASASIGGQELTVWILDVGSSHNLLVALSVNHCVWSGGARSGVAASQAALLTWTAALGTVGNIVIDSAAALAVTELYHALVYGRLVRPTAPAVRLGTSFADSGSIATLSDMTVASLWGGAVWRVTGRTPQGARFVFNLRQTGVVAEWEETGP
jgi:hypothetical protein